MHVYNWIGVDTVLIGNLKDLLMNMLVYYHIKLQTKLGDCFGLR